MFFSCLIYNKFTITIIFYMFYFLYFIYISLHSHLNYEMKTFSQEDFLSVYKIKHKFKQTSLLNDVLIKQGLFKQ